MAYSETKKLELSINRLNDNIKYLIDAIDSMVVALDRQSVLDLYDFYSTSRSDFYVPTYKDPDEYFSADRRALDDDEEDEEDDEE